MFTTKSGAFPHNWHLWPCVHSSKVPCQWWRQRTWSTLNQCPSALWKLIEALPDVGVENFPDGGLSQMFPTDPHKTVCQACPTSSLSNESNSPPGGDRWAVQPLSFLKRLKCVRRTDEMTTRLIPLWTPLCLNHCVTYGYVYHKIDNTFAGKHWNYVLFCVFFLF